MGDFYFLKCFIFETFEEYDILFWGLLEGTYFYINWGEDRGESLDANKRNFFKWLRCTEITGICSSL